MVANSRIPIPLDTLDILPGDSYPERRDRIILALETPGSWMSSRPVLLPTNEIVHVTILDEQGRWWAIKRDDIEQMAADGLISITYTH